MSYSVYRGGYTGPSHKIGGSSPYHIDFKMLQSLPVAEQVKAMDAVANQYGSLGREIEFSNDAVSGKKWNSAADLAAKVDLLERAAAAHGHSKHSGWDSFDFYVPFKGKSRFDKGAVEDASIYLPGVAGGKIRRGSGGGYGYFSEALDPAGKVLFRVGHGNVDRPETEAEIAIPAGQRRQPSQIATEAQVDPGETRQDFLKRYMQDQLQTTMMQQLLNPQQQPNQQAVMEQMMQAVGGLGILQNPMSV
jgi:hypothetical protein